MIAESLKYDLNKSTEDDICAHLRCCDRQFTPPLSERVDIEEYSRKIKESAITFEAWDRGTLVGLVAAYINGQDQSCFITNVSVMSDYTGYGIAARLIAACFESARTHGIELISLEVSANSHPAIHLYKKLGFEVISCRNDVLLMQRRQTA